MTAGEWLAKHRTAAIVTAGLVVVAVVATVLVVSVTEKGPKDVVQDYLDAIRAGDTEAALAIAGEPKPTGTASFLTADALADDWTVDRIIERRREAYGADDYDDAYVDVRLRAGEQTEEGRFHLVEDADGWTIETPFVEAELWIGDLDAVELGSRRLPVGTESDARGTVEVTLFPGVYHPYPSLRERLTPTPGTIIAAPQTKGMTRRVRLDFALTEEGAANANRVLSRHITDCAADTGVHPVGCPFSGERTLYGYHDVQSVTWSVVTMPEVAFGRPRDARRTVNTVLRKPGVARMTVTAVDEEGDPPTTFTADCEFGIERLVIGTTMDRFTVTETENRYLDTMCY